MGKPPRAFAMSRSITVVPHDPRWREQFAQERTRLAAALSDLPHALHHIGSTAIAGIPAKPVIDLMLLVDELAALDARQGALVALGYEAKGEHGIAQRRYFRRHSAEGVRTHHLHAFAHGSAHARRHLAFRDYMNAHPVAATAYGALKQTLAARHPQDSAAYVAGKDDFVQRHEALALAWATGDPAP